MANTRQLFLAAVWLCCCEGYNILAVFPFPGKSHSILGNAQVKLLLNAGHEVTYITAFPLEGQRNLRQIDVGTDNYPQEVEMKKLFNKEVSMSDPNSVTMMLINVTEHLLANEGLQRLINDPREQFDLVIAQWLFTELYSGFAAVFDCPYIWSSSLDTHPMILSLIDEPGNPAYTAGILSTQMPPFSFIQRAQQLWDLVRSTMFKSYYAVYYEEKVFRKWFRSAVTKRGRSLPPYEDIRLNASLVLANSHVSVGQSLRIPPSYKPIGGYHIETNVRPLSQHLAHIVNSSKNGVILLSLGSNVKSKDLPGLVIKNLLKMFGELKQTVLWKFEGDLKNVPKNVHVLKWAPQQSILSHPNCILFITHGGLLSSIETIHFGKPIVGIPIYADQFTNVDRAVQKGYAKRVDLSYDLAKDLKLAIEEVVSNSGYTTKAKELSLIYHDRPTPPGLELVHWVEHVVGTRGAQHLRSPALMVPWYQKMYLDLLLQIIVIIYVVNFCVRRVLSTKVYKKM